MYFELCLEFISMSFILGTVVKDDLILKMTPENRSKIFHNWLKA